MEEVREDQEADGEKKKCAHVQKHWEIAGASHADADEVGRVGQR
jgi:hypothetical protein